ncbi:MAG: DUF951 domain-containing protein [Chloroflexi bacterium]|nr:DUF951 domain-containing protein [Chloroflexota bacterium]
MIPEINAGEVYRMRRQHPCGGWEFRVYRTGADVGIECLTCGRRVMLDRRRFEARAKSLIASAPAPG